MLQNANTRCNGLLPLWGPQVSEAAFAACMAKHNIYLQEATRVRDITHQSTIHDLKLLILRFAQVMNFIFWVHFNKNFNNFCAINCRTRASLMKVAAVDLKATCTWFLI